MELEVLLDAIEELKADDPTIQNVSELASLYIVCDHMTKAETFREETPDILPSYRAYCNAKRQFQLHEIPEDAVVETINSLCFELGEFIRTLYSNTDMAKERRPIQHLLEALYTETQ